MSILEVNGSGPIPPNSMQIPIVIDPYGAKPSFQTELAALFHGEIM
jgi:hypothetical protein